MKKTILLVFLFVSINNYAQCWETISAGNGFIHAIKDDGSLWAWGSNQQGQLGDGTTINKNTPVNVSNSSTWVAISGGTYFTVGIKSNGTLWAWGNSFGGLIPTQVGNDSDWLKVAAGGFHALGIKNDGTLWAFGQNLRGQLGIGTIVNNYTPTQVGNGNDWQSISCGGYHSAAIKTDGTLWTWGYNLSGQIGDGGISNSRTTPYQVGTGTNWLSVSCGGGSASVIAMKTDYSIWGWGSNAFGGLGIGSTTDKDVPTRIGNLNDWQSIQTGFYHTFAIKNNGTLWACGYNTNGQLGDGSNTNRTTLVQIGLDTNWQGAFAGGNHSIGKKTDGTLLAWGYNNNGAIGDGTFISKNIPTAISGVCSNLNVSQIVDSKKLLLYPNPVNTILAINNPNDYEIEEISIVNNLGQTVLEFDVNATQIDLQEMVSGIYFITYKINNKVCVQKIIKE